MDYETREEILKLLTNSMELDIKTTTEYTGGMGGSDLYRNTHRIQLKLDGKVISEVYLD